MANLVIVLGSTGTGKSTSIKTLNPKETIIFNTLGKRLPFKGSSSSYSQEQSNMFSKLSYDQTLKGLNAINSSEKYAHIKNVVLDDHIYMMRNEFFARAQEKG